MWKQGGATGPKPPAQLTLVGVPHCPSFWRLLLVPPLSPEALLHTTSFKSPHLIFAVEKDQEAVDSATNREGGPSPRLAPEKQADGLNGATVAKKKIPIRSQFYH